MKKATFRLETVTPVFCRGANQRNAELRPAAFKGLMRYWYRALIAENDLKNLHETENKIFGSTKRGASFGIRIKDISGINSKSNKDKFFPLPHRANFRSEAIKDGVSFTLEIMIKQEKYFNKIKDTLDLALLLGGIGQRARRGFGSILNKEWKMNTKDDLLNYLKEILERFNRNYKVGNDRLIILDTIQKSYEYPVIKEIIIGKKNDNLNVLLKEIGEATHNNRDRALGNGNPRMASPVYVTVNKINNEFYSVITKLEAKYPYKKINIQKINGFVNELVG